MKIVDYGIGHERFRDIFKARSGEQLTSMEIKKAVHTEYRNLKLGSIIPSDHDGDHNLGECKCGGTGNEVFKRLGRNRYQVR